MFWPWVVLGFLSLSLMVVVVGLISVGVVEFVTDVVVEGCRGGGD